MAAAMHRRVEGYLGRLYGYARSLTRDDDRAKDLVQECAVRALSAKSWPEDESAFRSWLFTIARNALIDQIRRDRYDPLPDGDLNADDRGPWLEHDRFIAGITVRQGLMHLSAEHREIIGLVDISGFTYAEAATLLQVPIGTVMSRLARARKALLTAISRSRIRPFVARRSR